MTNSDGDHARRTPVQIICIAAIPVVALFVLNPLDRVVGSMGLLGVPVIVLYALVGVAQIPAVGFAIVTAIAATFRPSIDIDMKLKVWALVCLLVALEWYVMKTRQWF